jgi:hypothetical protein
VSRSVCGPIGLSDGQSICLCLSGLSSGLLRLCLSRLIYWPVGFTVNKPVYMWRNRFSYGSAGFSLVLLFLCALSSLSVDTSVRLWVYIVLSVCLWVKSSFLGQSDCRSVSVVEWSIPATVGLSVDRSFRLWVCWFDDQLVCGQSDRCFVDIRICP